MKRLFIILLCLVGLSVSAQTVGDSFSYIKEREEGEFYLSGEEEHPYFYLVSLKEVNSDVSYFFNKNLICTYEVIHPKTPESAKIWIDSFNLKWKAVSENKWEYTKKDNKVLVCDLLVMKNIYFLFDSDVYAFYIKEKVK